MSALVAALALSAAVVVGMRVILEAATRYQRRRHR